MATNGDVAIENVPIDQLGARCKTDIDKGLKSKDADDRLAADGPNELTKPPKPTLLQLFLAQLTGFIIILLICAAIASIVVNATGSNSGDILSYVTGKAIFIIVLLNAGIAAVTEHKAGDALDALSKMTQAQIDVIRDGKVVTVDCVKVVRGDIVVLGTGDVVPADMRLTIADDLKASEMCLTGEPEDVAKNIRIKQQKEGEPKKLTPENMVFSGCNITNGKGQGVVVQTGMGTRIGEIATMMAGGEAKTKCFGFLPDMSENQTPLQWNVQALGSKIGVMAIGVCIIVFIIGVAMGTTNPADRNNPSWLYMILISVTLAVAAIPEGIPLCVTISLSIGCSEMVSKNVLVRKLAAVETLGSASVICSDKTGTLTEGKMTMTNMWAGNQEYDVSGKGFDPTVGKISKKGTDVDARNEVAVRSALLAAILCCNTTLSKEKDPETGEEKWLPKGNSSEAPIVVAAQKIGFTESTKSAYTREVEIPFSSSRKMMLTVSSLAGRTTLCDGGMPLEPGTQYLTVCKGAPNYIIEDCVDWITEDGSVAPLEAARKKDILSIVDRYSDMALRVLAIAIHPIPSILFDRNDDNVDTESKFKACKKDLQLLGLVASIDPDRDGVKDSVEAARGAGIRVVMITGDYLKTAIAIAKNVRILQEDDDESVCAVDCLCLRPDGAYLDDEKINQLTARTRVFARAKPEDKLEIVKSLQRQDQVSAMTGDGVNDAPALNQADIGVAMGIQGTEVAKGASAMILTDDNFCSIVAAVEKGRAIYAGIQKFVAFIMSVHIAEVIQIFVCIVAGIPVMRTPLQILFLILVTDLPPSIALGMEPGEATILKQRPRPKQENIVLTWMWISIVANGMILSGVIIGIFVVCLHRYCYANIQQEQIQDYFGDDAAAFDQNLMYARTVAFISLVYSENVRAYISRSFDAPVWRNFFGNTEMQKAIVLAQICLYFAVFCPGFSDKVLKLDGIGIGIEGWIIALAGPVATTILCELFKIVTYHQSQRYQRRLQKDYEEAEEAKRREHAASMPIKKPVIADSAKPPVSANDVELKIDDKKPDSKRPFNGRGKNDDEFPISNPEAAVFGQPTNGTTGRGKCLPCGVTCFPALSG